ncbi:hypothetical protein [Xanthomonas phage RTH11]|nr:hypothetical protein [Xanthomonas phage RTH11]
MKQELIDARRAVIIKMLEDLDDLRQFYFGNLKALVEKSDSVDKRLFEQNRERLNQLTELLTEMVTGLRNRDPMNAVLYLEKVDSIPKTPQDFEGLSIRQLRTLLAIWPDVDGDGNELGVRVDGLDSISFPADQVRVMNDGDLYLRHK